MKRLSKLLLGLALAALIGLSSAQDREIVIAQGIDVPGFDPHGHHTTAVEAVLINLYDYLVFRNADGDLEPSLAVEWESVADDAWRFVLREGVLWHDGEPFTSEDVKFTLERVATDSGLQPHESYRQIREVEIISDHEIIIHTHGPDPLLLNRISRLSSGIAPRHHVEEVGWDGLATDPIGTGPYRFVEWRRDDRVILEAFDDHWRGRPTYDRVVHRTIPEDATRVSEMITGGVHIATNIPPQDRERVEGAGMASVVLQPTTRIMMLIFNTHEDAVTGDPRVREAIDYAIDNQLLIDAVMDGLGVPTRARISPGISGSPMELYGEYLYDPERAQELLQEAGYGPGELTIRVQGPAGRYPLDSELAEIIAVMLEEVGVNTEVEVLEWSAYQSRIWDADNVEHFVLMGLANSMFDNWFSMRAILCEGSYMNRVHWCNERFDELMYAAEVEVDLERRDEMLHEATYIVLEERPWVTLFQSQVLVGVTNEVEWQPRQDELLWMYAATPVQDAAQD
jgi:peptide/nickel transport system substrate-binding protein